MELKKFRIVVTEANLRNHSQAELDRLESMIKASGPEQVQTTVWKDSMTHSRVIDGEASHSIVHALMTLAKGEPLTPVLDALEQKHKQKE